MQRNSLVRPLIRSASIGLMMALGFGQAGAQCDITGPATLCGGSAELCGPPGPYYYDWRDPSGNPIGDQPCLSVTLPGTYRLSTFDFINGLAAGPCEHVVSGSADAPSCSIDGPTTACANTHAQLCAPEGADDYQWTGPGEFTASTRCIDVGVAGVYRVRAWRASTACWSGPCEREVSFGPCDAPKNYPMTPRELTQGCRSKRARPRGLFDQSQMSAIARCVDERASSFAWKDPDQGLCRTLDDCHGLRDRARRQFAGVLANVCARQLGLTPRTGPARGLDPATAVELDDFSGTVADWLALADARLGELEHGSKRHRKTKDAYRRIIRAGWHINHGLGMGPVCVPNRMVSSMLESDADAANPTAEELSLADELRDSDPAFTLESMEPNPMFGSTHIAYVIAADAADEIFIGVYDVTGRLVRVLDRGARAPGRHEAVWDGRDSNGISMKNGAYFVMGRLGQQRIAGRLILVR